jgi:Secretion system C-terminal sorting domain
VVKFEDGKRIELRGLLRAIGNATDSIIITSNNPQPSRGIWKGFAVAANSQGQSSQVEMEYCRVEYADTAFKLGATHWWPYKFEHCYFYQNTFANFGTGLGGLNYSNCTFESNKYGVVGNATVEDCHFMNNEIGMEQGEDAILRRSTFTGHTNMAVYFYGDMQQCEIWNNNLGVKSFHHSNTTFSSNYIHDNQIGIEMRTFFNNNPSIIFKHNMICNNAVWNIEYHSNNNADISDNCWCTEDSATIRSSLRDAYEDIQYGIMTFSPLSAICDSNTLGNPTPPGQQIHVTLFPNPVTDHATLSIEGIENGNYQLWITDITGKIILEMPVTGAGDIQIARNHTHSGLYFYRLTEKNTTIVQGKFLVL